MKLLTSIFLAIIILSACKAEQKIIFSGDSISYKNKDSYLSDLMSSECKSLSENLDDYLKNGWKIVTSSSKEKIVAHNSGTCKGTEYVLEK